LKKKNLFTLFWRITVCKDAKGDIKMLQLVFIGIFVAGGFWFYNSFLLGNKKNNIVLTFDDRFTNLDEHITAIKRELTYEGRKVEYLGNRKFIVDGKPYIFVERTVPNLGEGVPVQQTILEGQR